MQNLGKYLSQKTTKNLMIRNWPPLVMVMLFFSILFVGYFLFQANDFIFGPELALFSPKDGETVRGSVVIAGKTDPRTTLTINGYETYSDEAGIFEENLPLGAGFHIIDVIVKNRFGKESRITRSIVVK